MRRNSDPSDRAMPNPGDEEWCLVIGRWPPGFRVIQGFVEGQEQQEIEHWIRGNFFWTRRRQGNLPPSEEYPYDAPIPDWADALGTRMTALRIFQSRPDHVLLRRYEHGVGFEPHIDSAAYGPVVAGLTLGSSRAFQLTRRLKGSRLETILFPGDLYVMSGPARYRWRHSIPARLEDTFRGVSFPRTGGFSATWRFLRRCSGRESGASRFQTTAKPLPR
jgi:alkylated DNA repair dioxygenase AlkB